MPLPKPKKGEKRADFIASCMINPHAKSEFSEEKQRLGYCESTFDEHAKHHKREYTGKEVVERVACFRGNFPVAQSEETADDGKTHSWFSVSSETPCLDRVKIDGEEQDAFLILSHKPENVDMTHIRDGIPLRDGHVKRSEDGAPVHGTGEQIALLESPTIRAGKLGGMSINWSVSERAQLLRADYERGVRRDASLEADVDPKSLSIEGEYSGLPLIRVNRWKPLAAALAVVVGADPNVGINRAASVATVPSAESPKNEPKEEAPDVVFTTTNVSRSKIMTPEELAAQSKARANEVCEIMAVCRHFRIPDEKTDAFIRDGAALVDVQRYAISNPGKAEKETPAVQRNLMDGAPKGKTFSIARAIVLASDLRKGEKSGVDYGFEREVQEACVKVLGPTKREGAIRIPWDAPMPKRLGVQRAFTTVTGTGANAIEETLHPELFIEYLYSWMILQDLGVMQLPGLVGDCLLPKQTGTDTGYWVDETTAVTSSVPTIGQVKGTPHTMGATTDISRQMMLQATPSAETLVNNSLVEVMARTIQIAYFHGTGANNQPLGLFPALVNGYQNQVQITPVTISGGAGTPNFADAVAFSKGLAVAKVRGPYKWAMSAQSFYPLLTTSRTSAGYPIFVADKEDGKYNVADDSAEITTDITAGYAALGRFDMSALAYWGSTELIVDPYTLSQSGQLRIVALQAVDVLYRYLAGFQFSSQMGS